MRALRSFLAKEELIGAEVAWKLFSDDITSSERLDTSTKNRSDFFVWPFIERHTKKGRCAGERRIVE